MPETQLKNFRKQYPQYNDVEDTELLDRMYSKYYSDIPRSEFLSAFTAKFGDTLNASSESIGSTSTQPATVSGEAAPGVIDGALQWGSDFVGQLGESLQRGVFRQLPQQIDNALNFSTRLMENLPHVTYPGEGDTAPVRGVTSRNAQPIGKFANQVQVPEAQPELQQINGIEDLGDPRKLANVIGEQGPAMIANIAATMANPALGVAFIGAMEAGESLQSLDDVESLGETEKLIISGGVGGLNAALEKLGIDVILGKVPGLKSRLARLLVSPVSEATTEGLQEINQILGQNVGEGGEVFQFDEEDFARLRSAVYGGGVLGFLGGGSSAVFGGSEVAPDKKTAQDRTESENPVDVSSVPENDQPQQVEQQQASELLQPSLPKTQGEPAAVGDLNTPTSELEEKAIKTKLLDDNVAVEQTPSTKKRVPGERSFPKTLEDAGLEGGTDRFYDVYSDEKASKQAQDRILADEAAAYIYAKDETKELSKEQVTTGIYLMQKMQSDMKNAQTESEKQMIADKQIEMASSLSRRLTQAGQSIQAASIVSKLSPESLLLYATRKVNEINKRNGKKQVQITPEDVTRINTLSKSATVSADLESATTEAKKILKNYADGKPVQNGDIEKLTNLSKQIDKALGKSRKKSISDSIDKTLSEAEQKARERLKKRGYNLNVGINPQDLADITIIGAAKIGRTGIKFVKWSNAMIEDFGEDIRPHLKRVFGKSVDLYKSENKKIQNSRRLQQEINGVLRKMEANTEVTPEQLETVSSLVDKVKNYSEDAKTEALYELQDFLNSFEKPGIGRKLATGQVLAQLLNPKTIIRNIVGNELFYRVERLNKYIASPIDWAKSALTGNERTVTFRTGKQSGFWEGFMKGAKAGWQGHNIYNLETQFDLKGSTFRSKHNPLHWLEKALGVALRGFDTAAYNRAYNQFLGEQAELSIINKKLTFKSKEARQKYIEDYISQVDINIEMMAHEEGKYITFQDENTLSRTFTGLKRLLNLNKDFGVGDFILKYPKTPANLLHRALEYSPAGFARSVSILTRPYLNPDIKNRDIVMAVSRAITGTFGFTGLGAVLYSMGAISGEEDKDRKVTQFKSEQTGERNYQVNISAINRFVTGGFNPDLLKKRNGDLLVSYDWAQPVAISIAAGANMAKAITEGKTFLKSGGDIAYESLNAAMNTLVEQPLLRGVQDALGSKYDKDILRKFSNILTQIPSSFVPTLFSQIRQFTDNDKRITYDPNPLQKAINRAIYKLPFISKTLPRTFKTLGINEYAETYKDGSNTLFNVFFNPAFISRYSIDPEIALLLEPYEKEGRKGQIPKTAPYTLRAAKSTLARYGLIINEPNHSFKLTGQDIADFQRQMAEYVTVNLRDYNTNYLSSLSFDKQEKVLSEIVTDSYEETKKWFFTNKAKIYLRKE